MLFIEATTERRGRRELKQSSAIEKASLAFGKETERRKRKLSSMREVVQAYALREGIIIPPMSSAWPYEKHPFWWVTY